METQAKRGSYAQVREDHFGSKMRPRISKRGSVPPYVHASVNPYVRYHSGKSVENEDLSPHKQGGHYRTHLFARPALLTDNPFMMKEWFNAVPSRYRDNRLVFGS